MMARKKAAKKATIGELLRQVHELRIEVVKSKADVLGTLKPLVEMLGQLEPLLKQTVGELRAVRYLLDEKKQYAFMDKPRPPLDSLKPIPERVL